MATGTIKCMGNLSKIIGIIEPEFERTTGKNTTSTIICYGVEGREGGREGGRERERGREGGREGGRGEEREGEVHVPLTLPAWQWACAVQDLVSYHLPPHYCGHLHTTIHRHT